MREQRSPHRQDHRHRPYHQRRMAHRRNRQPIELKQELQRNPQKRSCEQHGPLPEVQSRPMHHQQRRKRHHREQEPVQHHMREVHLRQRNLAEEEPASPQRTSQRTRAEAQHPTFLQNSHTSTLAQNKAGAAEAAPARPATDVVTRPGSYPPEPSANPSCIRTPPQIPADSQSLHSPGSGPASEDPAAPAPARSPAASSRTSSARIRCRAAAARYIHPPSPTDRPCSPSRARDKPCKP